VKRAYLGEEDECWSIRRRAGARGDRGMMDYAGRVAQADTYPKLLRLNARTWRRDRAARKGFWIMARVHLNDYQTRVHDFALA